MPRDVARRVALRELFEDATDNFGLQRFLPSDQTLRYFPRLPALKRYEPNFLRLQECPLFG
jgi:hypothetical protein